MSMRTKSPLAGRVEQRVARPRGSPHRRLEPERRRLDAQVRVEPLALDRGEQVDVQVGVLGGLVSGRDLFAEQIERRGFPSAFSRRTTSTASPSSSPAM